MMRKLFVPILFCALLFGNLAFTDVGKKPAEALEMTVTCTDPVRCIFRVDVLNPSGRSVNIYIENKSDTFHSSFFHKKQFTKYFNPGTLEDGEYTICASGFKQKVKKQLTVTTEVKRERQFLIAE